MWEPGGRDDPDYKKLCEGLIWPESAEGSGGTGKGYLWKVTGTSGNTCKSGSPSKKQEKYHW